MGQRQGAQHATISVLAVGLDVHIVLHATGGMLPGCVIRWLLKVLGYGQMGAPWIDVEQPAHSGVPPSVGLPAPQASQAAQSTLDDSG